ncbi:hypothetical protein BS17DRAFT_214695 [Gyrodon lividus]|nr:hypothetical protein BS17DRAFT_214695 [Gyrodon lividus]
MSPAVSSVSAASKSCTHFLEHDSNVCRCTGRSEPIKIVANCDGEEHTSHVFTSGYSFARACKASETAQTAASHSALILPLCASHRYQCIASELGVLSVCPAETNTRFTIITCSSCTEFELFETYSPSIEHQKEYNVCRAQNTTHLDQCQTDILLLSAS